MFTSQTQWLGYTEKEIEAVKPILAAHDITLADNQPHISGERFLMSGRKVVLVGTNNATRQRVIIKTSNDPQSVKEITHESITRNTLHELPFAYQPLLAPQELWQEKSAGRITVVSEYIEQETPYLSLPLTQQFDFILEAFQMLAGVHATTSAHTKRIKHIFGLWSATDYVNSLQSFIVDVQQTTSITPYVNGVLLQAAQELNSHTRETERYCNFLTHDDFALHNVRLHNQQIYLIDHASLRFGNKHESWARFMNYMLLYNRELEQALQTHLQLNAAEEELSSLRLMRMYKAAELIRYHSQAADRADGNIKTLSQKRVHFWTKILQSLFLKTAIKEEVILAYTAERDALRSEEEKRRQQELQQLL